MKMQIICVIKTENRLSDEKILTIQFFLSLIRLCFL